MSGVYSCNNNQNYFIRDNRSTSRVLQPPGGKSSFSLSYDIPADRPPSGPSRGRVDAGRQEPAVMQSLAVRRGSDSLDEFMNSKEYVIPGLENHYRSRGQSSHTSTDSSDDIQTSIRDNSPRMTSQQLYASQLRQQIEAKKEIDAKLNSDRGTRDRRVVDTHFEEGGIPPQDPNVYDKAMKLYKDNSAKQKPPMPSSNSAAVGRKGTVSPSVQQQRGVAERAKSPRRKEAESKNEKVRTSVAVHQPPGGRSSLSLGWS